MDIAQERLARLRETINDDFPVEYLGTDHDVNGRTIHKFQVPMLEASYSHHVPESPELEAFMKSPEYKNALVSRVEIGVALLDLVGFSTLKSEDQFKMIVRYQRLVRSTLKGKRVAAHLSIGDGTIFVFGENDIATIPQIMYEIRHAIEGFNMDFPEMGIPTIDFRIGVHVGEAYRFKDINGQENYIGPAMNMAQRISTLVSTGDSAGLLSFKVDSRIYVSEEALAAFRAENVSNEFHFDGPVEGQAKHGTVIRGFAMSKPTHVPMTIRWPKK